MGDGEIGWAQAEAVSALGEEVELGGDLCVLERLKVDERVFYVGGVVVLGLDEEGGWELRCWGERRAHFAVGAAEPAGVNDHLEVGAGVDGGWGNVTALEVGVGAEDGGEVGSGGKADDADAVGIDVPLGCVGASDAHGLLRVFEVFGVLGEVSGFGDAVLDEDAGHADGVEPVADFGAFDAD